MIVSFLSSCKDLVTEKQDPYPYLRRLIGTGVYPSHIPPLLASLFQVMREGLGFTRSLQDDREWVH
jgi:hypothetical protein